MSVKNFADFTFFFKMKISIFFKNFNFLLKLVKLINSWGKVFLMVNKNINAPNIILNEEQYIFNDFNNGFVLSNMTVKKFILLLNI